MMKNRFFVALVLGMMALCTMSVHANNDFLEQINNYSVMSMGNGVVRFKIPIWSYGWQNNYRLGIGSHVWYSMNQSGSGSSQIMYFRSTDRQNCSDPKVNSSADVDLRAGMGTVKITRTTSGTVQIDAGSGNHSVSLPAQRSLDGSFDRVVYLEFDWYLPESLTNQQFYVGMSVNIFKYKADDTNSDNKYNAVTVLVSAGRERFAHERWQSGYSVCRISDAQVLYHYAQFDTGEHIQPRRRDHRASY